MNNKYNFAGLIVNVTGFDDEYFEKSSAEYLADNDAECDIIIRTEMKNDFPENKYTNLLKLDNSQYFHEGTNLDTLIFYDDELCRIIAKAEFDKEYSNVRIILADLSALLGLEQSKFLFNVMGICMQYIIRMYSGFVFHSSAIAVNGEGIAFSADSGIGKSTHTALWKKHIPGTVIINDDTPFIRVSDGKVRIYGSPWAGTSGVNSAVSVPLKAIVFLERSKENKITPLSDTDAIKSFTNAVRDSVTSKMYIKSLDTMDDVMKNVRIYSLLCNKKSAAVFTVKNEIWGNGGKS